MLRGAAKPFQPTGGLRVLEGPLGRAVIKTSAVAAERHVIEAPARVFHSQEELHAAFRAGELFRDVVVVVRFQGPQANGMPELHKLMPPLGIAQDRGHRVALVTDGRLSGASGKVPAAIHVTPEAAAGGAIGKIRDGDIIRVDAVDGRLEVLVDPANGRRGRRRPSTSRPRMSASGATCSARSARGVGAGRPGGVDLRGVRARFAQPRLLREQGEAIRTWVAGKTSGERQAPVRRRL